jgi:hypothetical protein
MTSSFIVFQLPQLGQRPIQRGLVSPQLEQTYTVFNFGSFIFVRLPISLCVSLLPTFYHAFHSAASDSLEKQASVCSCLQKARDKKADNHMPQLLQVCVQTADTNYAGFSLVILQFFRN